MKLTFSRIILVSTKKTTPPSAVSATAGAASQCAREDSKRIFKTLSSHSTQHTTASASGVGIGTGIGTSPTGSNPKDIPMANLPPHTPSPIYSASMSDYASQASSKNASPRGTRKKAGSGLGSGLCIDVDTATNESTDTADDRTPHR